MTIVVRGRQCLFGEVEGQTMRLNDAGQVIEQHWPNLPNRFPFCELDDWVVMPNHIHGILVFDNPASEQATVASHMGGTNDNSLSRVMQAFKSLTTTDYIKGVPENSWPPFDKKLWLRNYWERVIRNDRERNSPTTTSSTIPLNGKATNTTQTKAPLGKTRKFPVGANLVFALSRP